MRLVSYNIQYGIGLDGRFDPARIAGNLRGADIIALQEVTRGSLANGRADLVAIMAGLLADFHWVYGPACDLHRFSAVIDGRRVDERFQFGNMILSRWPILSHRLLLLPRSRTYEKLNLQRGASEAVIATPGQPLRVYCTHLDHVAPDERIAQIGSLRRQIQAFLVEGGAITGAATMDLPQPPAPEDYVVLGDLNMQPESPEYIAMVGHRDAYYGRTARADMPIDALARLGRLTPDSYSWQDAGDPDRRLQLDYAFVSGSLAPRLVDAFVDVAAEGSDHFPVWIDLAPAPGLPDADR